MNQNHKYILQPYKSLSDRYTCPSCGEKNKFSRYIDIANSEQLGNHVGRCERSDNCGYHFTPSDYFKANPTLQSNDERAVYVPAVTPKVEPSFIDKEIFNQSLSGYEKNVFAQFLTSTFGEKIAKNLIEKYKVGTTKTGSTIFYQIDLWDRIKTGKIIKYNQVKNLVTHNGIDCKRDKTLMPNWVHKALKIDGFNLSQCFFGEHLITDNQTIAVCEAEKTAIIASVYLPQYTWLSCGGKEGLGTSKMQVLKGKDVILFPDLNGFNKWSDKAKELSLIAKSITVSSILEDTATDQERANGLDLADYLLRYEPPSNQLSNVELDLFSYFLTETKFLDYSVFTIDNQEIDNLPFDVGFHLGILNNSTAEQINEASDFVNANSHHYQNLFIDCKIRNLPFRHGYNYGLIDSEKESKKDEAIRVLTIIKNHTK
jgi:uncharacterized protein YchJ